MNTVGTPSTGEGRRIRPLGVVERLFYLWSLAVPVHIREVFDRLDGRPAQVVDRGDVPLEALSDRELFAIIRGGSRVEEPIP
jgi:hypothetical protein